MFDLTHRTRLLFAALLLAALGVSPVASAQELKIGVVNVQALLQQAPQTKASLEALQEEFAPRERTVLAKQKELEELSEKAQRDLAVMGEEERRSMERQLRDGRRDLERLQAEFVEESNLRRNEELAKLQRVLLQQVDTYARENGYDIIFGDGVIFASGRTNITRAVLDKLTSDFETAAGGD
ncbi:MAG: OmpH family outer membrane protein [Pseudomonadota bacterium]